MRNRPDRLRALNVPQRVEVELDERGVPAFVKPKTGNGKRIESIGETWRIDDEWWRRPISRRHVAADQRSTCGQCRRPRPATRLRFARAAARGARRTLRLPRRTARNRAREGRPRRRPEAA